MILCILQARMSSTRLPGKVMKPLLGESMIKRQIDRIKQSKKIDQLCVATSSDPSDDIIESYCQKSRWDCFRGSLNNVLDRYYQASLPYQPDHIVRLTADCPLSDPEIIDLVLSEHIKTNADYSSNTIQLTFPDGLDVEIFTSATLKKTWQHAKHPDELEHVTRYIHTHPEIFSCHNVAGKSDLSHLRWTVDTSQDFEIVSKIFEKLFPLNSVFNMKDILNIIEADPALKINSIHRN